MGSLVAHPNSCLFADLLFPLWQSKKVIMKKLIVFAFICLAIGCQKVELGEQEGRNAKDEQKDSASVTPTFEAEDWEGVIDVGFGF